LSRMNVDAPKNFVRKSRDRDTGLLNSKSMAPGSNVCGTVGAVTRIAISTPRIPAKNVVKVARAKLTNSESCFGSKGRGVPRR